MEDEPKRICDFDRKVSVALEQVKQWQEAYGFDFRLLPGYDEAAAVSEEQVFLRIMTGLDKVNRKYPDALGSKFRAAFAGGRPNILSMFASDILDAARNEDEEFFIALGVCLQKRKLQTLATLSTAAFAESCQGLVDALWADGLLWLMTDEAAVEYFGTVLGLTVTPDAYTAAYSRRGYLKHPDRPIIGITKEQKERRQYSGAKVESSKPLCSLDLRRGWIFAKRTLMPVSS